MIVTGGSVDVTTYFSMRLLTGGDGTGLTISDFDMQYVRTGATPAAKVDAVALAAANTAHTDNRGIEVDSTDTPGLYRFDWPDAAFAAGVREVILSIKHASCFTEHLRVEIDPSVTAGTVSDKTGYALTSAYDFAKGTTAVTEAYNADGAAPTPVQALMLILQMLTEKSISGTTLTVKKLDGSTGAATFTLNDATSPTSITRAT